MNFIYYFETKDCVLLGPCQQVFRSCKSPRLRHSQVLVEVLNTYDSVYVRYTQFCFDRDW